MAKYSPIFGQLSKSIAGQTFSHNKGGPYVRRRAIPTNPNAAKQQLRRQALSALSAQWASLSPTRQAAWADWASLHPIVDTLGNTILRSGQQAFVGLNARLASAGIAAVLDPPTTNEPQPLTSATPTATAATGVISVAFTPTPLPAGLRIVIWTTLPASAGRNPNFNQARLVGYSAAAQVSPATVTSPYPAISGQQSNIFVGVMDASGQVSPPLKTRVTWA